MSNELEREILGIFVKCVVDSQLDHLNRVPRLPAKVSEAKALKVEMKENQSRSDSSAEARRKSLEDKTFSDGSAAVKKDTIPSFAGTPIVRPQNRVVPHATGGAPTGLTADGKLVTVRSNMATDALDKQGQSVDPNKVLKVAGGVVLTGAAIAGGVALANSVQNTHDQPSPTPDVVAGGDGTSTLAPEVTNNPGFVTPEAPTSVAPEFTVTPEVMKDQLSKLTQEQRDIVMKAKGLNYSEDLGQFTAEVNGTVARYDLDDAGQYGVENGWVLQDAVVTSGNKTVVVEHNPYDTSHSQRVDFASLQVADQEQLQRLADEYAILRQQEGVEGSETTRFKVTGQEVGTFNNTTDGFTSLLSGENGDVAIGYKETTIGNTRVIEVASDYMNGNLRPDQAGGWVGLSIIECSIKAGSQEAWNNTSRAQTIELKIRGPQGLAIFVITK